MRGRRGFKRTTTSAPFTTRPNTVCLLSSQGAATVVIKNWEPEGTARLDEDGTTGGCAASGWRDRETTQAARGPAPLVFGPALAMDTVKGRSCRKSRRNSSSNSRPLRRSEPP